MNDVISWDKAIGRKIRSSDGKYLGKVQRITRDYIQTAEGRISQNYYFIPKRYLSGHDGDGLWVSLTKDEVKSRFEREKAPEPAEWERPEYAERRTTIMERHPEFATNIPAGMFQMSWDKIIGRKVRSSDSKDMGDVESVASYYIGVKEGVVSKKRYRIPKYYILGFDGDSLYASLTKAEIKDRFERASSSSPDLEKTSRAKTGRA
jgi:hypothetical protein